MRLSKIFFIRQPEIIYDRIICSFTICLSYQQSHPLSSLSPFFYICSWLSNKPPQEIINNPISLLLSCPPFFENNRAFYIFALKNVYF